MSKTVTIQEHPLSSPPHVLKQVVTYNHDTMGEYSYYFVRGREQGIPYEVIIPLGNIIYIKIEG